MNFFIYGACLAGAMSLCACNPLMTASLQTLKEASLPREPLQLTQAQVDAVPFPQIKVTTVSAEGVMALVRQRGDLQYWVASGKQVLLMRNGLIVRTVGLGVNLDGTRLQGKSPFETGLHLLPNGFDSIRWLDIYEGYHVDVQVRSHFVRRGVETIRIIDRDYRLLRLDEQIEIPDLDFHAVNSYWVRPGDGFIVQSEQHLTPALSLKVAQLNVERGANE